MTPSESAELLALIDSRIDERIAERLADVPRYEGTWRVGTIYRRGAFVTDRGSLWHCGALSTTERPGVGLVGWCLAAKRGRDGRDVPS